MDLFKLKCCTRQKHLTDKVLMKYIKWISSDDIKFQAEVNSNPLWYTLSLKDLLGYYIIISI